MTREVLSVEPDTGVESAARLMHNRRVSGLPVVEDDRPVGVISLMDLVDPDRAEEVGKRGDAATYYALADGDFVTMGAIATSGDAVVRDVMTPYVISVAPGDSVAAAARQMTEYGVHRLLVMEGPTLVGLVSSLDLLRGFLMSGED